MKPRAGAAQTAPKESILVVGRGYGNILNAIRSFGVAGYNVEVLRVFKSALTKKSVLRSMHPESSSRYLERYAQCVAANEDDLVEAILSFSTLENKKLLFPVDDFTACVIDRNSERFADFFHLTGFRGERSLAYYAQKYIQKNLAESYGLSVIPGEKISLDEWNKGRAYSLSYPCFVKPNVSAFSSKSRISKCGSEDDLRRILSQCSSIGEVEVLVENCVDILEEYSLLGVSTGENAVIYGVLRAEVEGSGARRGVMLVGELLPVDPFRGVVDKCCQLMAGVGYVGVFDIDLLKSANGNLYFTEVNFRPGASTYSMMLLDNNLPAILADYIFHGTVPEDCSEKRVLDKTFINEKVLLEEYIFGGITAAEKNSLAKAEHFPFIRSAADPAPYRVFRLYWHAAALFRLRNKILRARRARSARLMGIDVLPQQPFRFRKANE